MSGTLSYLSVGRVLERRGDVQACPIPLSWVNNPELFAVLPLLLALMLISTRTCTLRCTRTHTHITPIVIIFHLPLADTSLSFSFSPPVSPSVYLHIPLCSGLLKTENTIRLVFAFLVISGWHTKKERKFADILKLQTQMLRAPCKALQLIGMTHNSLLWQITGGQRDNKLQIASDNKSMIGKLVWLTVEHTVCINTVERKQS